MVALVIIEHINLAIDQKWSYKVPSIFINSIKIGIRVKVPFGHQILEGFVMELINEDTNELKEIIELVDDEPILNCEMIKLGFYMKERFLCTLVSAYQTMLPKALKASHKTNINKKGDMYLELNKIDLNTYKLGKVAKKIIDDLKIKNQVLKRNYNTNSVKKLLDEGILKEIFIEKYRLDDNYDKVDKIIILNEEQQKVVNEIINNIDKAISYLLHGITGSGKTEVYINIIKEVLRKKKEAIVLVPEISLTPQIINRFKNVFGNNIAILHSRLSNGERYDEYRKIINKEVSIVIGARSAVFAPFTNLGVIIIDEEHSDTYKQENSPKYDTIDIASWRSEYHNCPVILGSATPNIISYAKGVKGIYKLLTITSRIGKATLPITTLVDMAKEYKKKNYIISDLLKEKITDRLLKQEQVMILLNRRGYTPTMMCTSCGYIHKCPRCDLPLTYHKTTNTMRCHYCGYGDRKKSICPSCQKESFADIGCGTQKLEETINRLFPNAKTIRMDLDTTSNKGAHQKIINDFNNKNYGILIGTQMIAKGLDFENVTLVGVINADASLNIPDYRSGERTFQLLNQVSGRAGRGEKKGEVVIQTFNDNHYSIKYATNNNYIGFFNEEMAIRKKIGYPPYTNLVLVKISSKDYELVKIEGNKIKEYLNNSLCKESIVLGPTTASVFKINNVYTLQCLIKYKKDPKLKTVLNDILVQYKKNSKVKIDIDFNPLRV